MPFYDADLARIHDEGFGDFGRAAARELLARLAPSGLVVELGCGSGITSEVLSDAGYDVLGIDIAPEMLAIARSRAPRAQFVEGSAWGAEIPPCVAVTAIGEVLNYAVDRRAGEQFMPALFARVYAALQPGGVFMFDFATPGRGTLRRGGPGVAAGDDWRIVADTREDAAERTLERRMTIDYRGRRREEVHHLRLYDPDLVRECLEGPGFASEALHGYGDLGFWPGYAAFAAVKPEPPRQPA